jgi:trk system potassium uptake protein TrkH
MRLFGVQRVIGVVVVLSGIVMVPPLIISLVANDGIAAAFLESLGASTIAGLALWLPVRKVHDELRLRDGFLITSATWILVSLTCALPFMLGPPHLTLVDAYFESTSGLTTTGATVIVGLDSLPKSMLFYRQSLCFLGGMGIVILAVAPARWRTGSAAWTCSMRWDTPSPPWRLAASPATTPASAISSRR